MKARGRIIAFFLLVIALIGIIGTTSLPIAKDIKLGLDLQGGFEVLYEVTALEDGQEITESVLTDTTDALMNRINVLGVSEPVIQIEGDNRIRVQLAGVEDQSSARELLSTEANLTFRDAEDNLLLAGNDLKQGGATGTFDSNGNPIVTLELNDPGKFAEVTESISQMPAPDNVLVIWLDFEEGVDSFAEERLKADPKFVSAPSVSQRISSPSVEISGSFTVEETQNLSGILNAGALPVSLTEIYSTSVGAQFGEQALDQTMVAAAVGIALVLLFMLIYYRLPGMVAVVTLSAYVYLILLVFEWIGGVLTLPGIAAIMLGVGMAVDANIITYERIREEMRVGKSVKEAFKVGARSSFSAIIDANVTTLLAAIVLFYFGTSSVKGFATLLIISILVSFLTAVWGSRLLLGLWVNSGALDHKPGLFGLKKSVIHSPEEGLEITDLSTRFDRFDFAGNRNKFFLASIVLIVAGMAVLGVFRLNLGIDFSSGTRVEIASEAALTKEEVQSFLDGAGFETDDIVISGDESNIGVARYNEEFSQEEINSLKATAIEEFGSEPNVSTVSATVGQELAKNALYALSIAALGIIIYVAFRFEWRMGVASVVALIHDAFFIVAIFSMLRLEVDITFIAAVLTIIGYSINDTIVTFDRIRENMKRMKKIDSVEQLEKVVNVSLRQTLGRSVNTVLTVLLVVIALLIFGAPSITNFSIALLIGLIAGTYSSIFIAAQLWLVLKKGELKKKGPIDIEKKEQESKWGSDEPVV
ncbi:MULTISPECIES: protein translocase subunit SecDF [Planococcus]|uniref:Multifunctional fusion protein n=1 Tax=Planococcus faecalis TaxID=1598147 RepID=A0ABN4XH51_9BACL|nr:MULTISPECIES: protein translocase subunit SecDF [Planococcus]AQU79081.1 protein translocase subunit SecDF [Planococcus faecalis]MDJ0331021.1 protein translocase subunit SecDF [Planococcus sp. S3-L1]OHX51728.1 protein translocase subunit SecDF [Planococcus faecalis]